MATVSPTVPQQAPAAQAPAAQAPAPSRQAPAARPDESTPRPAPTATPTPTWAEVAAASQPARRPPAASVPESHDEDVSLNAGDVILHPRFQRCVVHRVEGNGEFVQVTLRNGRVVRLSLEVLRLTPNGVENGQRIFTATVL